MKHTYTFFNGFQDSEQRLIHLLEDGNPPLPAFEADGPEQKESTDKPKTEKLDAQGTTEDVRSVGETALADAQKDSTDLQGEVRQAQEDVNRIRLAAALGDGGLTAEEEHSAATQRLEEAQAKALMEDHNPMSGGNVSPEQPNADALFTDHNPMSGKEQPETTPSAGTTAKTHEQKPDGFNEAEDLVVSVDPNSNHVEEHEAPQGGGDNAGGNGEAPPLLKVEPPSSPEANGSTAPSGEAPPPLKAEPPPSPEANDATAAKIEASDKIKKVLASNTTEPQNAETGPTNTPSEQGAQIPEGKESLKDRAPRTPSERIEKGLELVRNAKTVGDLLKGLTEVFKGLGDYMKGIREYPNAKEPSKENKEEERNTKGEQVESRENTEEDDRRNVLRNEMKEKDMSASELKEAKQEELKDGDKKIDTRIDKLESEIDALDQENDEAKKQVRDIEQRLAADDVPEEEGFDLKNQLEDLKTDIKGRDEKIERREEQRKQSLEEKGNNDESLKKDIEELDKMLKELKEKVDTIRETFDKLEQAGSLDANELAIVKGILVAGNEKTMEVDFTLTADAVGALDTVLRSAKMAEADIGVQGNNVVDPVKFMEEFSTMLDKYNKTKPDLNQDAGTDPRRVENIV